MQKYSDVVLDKDGNGIASATVVVTTYPDGLPATIYAADGGPPVPSLVTDASGRFAFYAANGHYTVTVTGQGISPVSYNDVTLFDPRNLPASVKDAPYNAKGDGVTDDTAAFQAAFSALSSIYIPAGSYRISGTISKVTTGALRVYGAGIGLTAILQYADADLFSVTNTGGSSQIVFENMDLRPRVMMTAGAAINVRNDSALPSLRVSNVFIGQSSTYEFKYGIKAANCTEALFERVIQYGLSDSSFIPWYITSTTAATVPKWLACSVYNASVGAKIVSASAPGVEGVQFYGCDLVNVKDGVVFQNSYGTNYFPPQLTWIGGHVNANRYNFDLAIMSQLTINGALLYNTGSDAFVRLDTCSGYSITSTQMINQGGSANGIRISATTGPINGGIISDNNFELNSASTCISIDATQPINNLRITGNQRMAGSKTLEVTAGYMSGSVVVKDNTPDPEDIVQSLSPVGPGNAWLSLTGLRSDYFTVSGIGSAVTITTLIGRREGEVVTLRGTDATITLQHNAPAADGFDLKGGANFALAAGASLVLRRSGGRWVETLRSA